MHLRKPVILYLLVSVIFFTGCETKTETADLILTNGKLLLMDEDFSTADALAIRGAAIATTDLAGILIALPIKKATV